VPTFLNARPPGTSQNDEGFTDENEATGSTIETLLDASSKGSGGHHSRFRKDLINLNKAVSKWIRKEKKGDMTKEQVIETIRESKVLRHLRDLHGALFKEDEFIGKLYMQRDVVPHDEAPAPCARALERKSSGPHRSRASRCG